MLEFFAGLLVGYVLGVWFMIDEPQQGVPPLREEEDDWNYR